MNYDQLTVCQQKAVSHRDGPLLVIAGPGSGKTRVITCRIAALIASGVRAGSICALTFTNKAADEMKTRYLDTPGAYGGAHISTFHSLCVKILRNYADAAGIRPNFSIYDAAEQAACIRQAVKDCELETKSFPPARMLDAISALKQRLIDFETFHQQADEFFTRNVARVYAAYQSVLTKANALDFDDLLMKTALMLEAYPDICRQLGDRFKFILIDEYQDTNHAQYKIAKSIASVHGNICVTGDPDQSIYRWRGADIGNILAFEKDWPDAVVVKLEQNFRSVPDILSIADSLISFNRSRKPKTLIPTKNAAGSVCVQVFEDEIEETESAAQQIRQLIAEGASAKDTAVFYRVNSMSRLLEKAFIRNEIPYQIVRGVEFFGRKEIRDVLAYLKVLVNPSDQVALLRIINTPARGIGKTTISKIGAYAGLTNITFYNAIARAAQVQSLSQASKTKVAVFVDLIERFRQTTLNTGQSMPVAAVIELVFNDSGLAQSLKEQGQQAGDAIDNVNELINDAAQYQRSAEQPSLLDYLQQISLFSDVDSYDTGSQRVALMTLHNAKGLEFENVFIVGLEDGLLPHERSCDDAEEMEEERRLFFVGITRAKTNLYISSARYRTIHGQLLRTTPSPFLYELGPVAEQALKEGENALLSFAEYDQGQAFAQGQRVTHKTFGVGTVRQFHDMGENSIAVVEFSSGQTKSLMVKYAGLSRL
ncbi:MAG TPA: UvrD-helicase domain-containing protein [Sedimentisphaerales bacterium]|nr:UvrD-helicase domain-containing protein [Sedimentisphaerales bacterium]